MWGMCVCVYIYREHGILSHKKEWNNVEDGPRDYHKWSQKEKDRYHMILLIG